MSSPACTTTALFFNPNSFSRLGSKLPTIAISRAGIVCLLSLLHFGHPGRLPCPVNNGRRFFAGPIESQHQREPIGRRREPVRLLALARGIFLNIEIGRTVRVWFD